MSQHPEQKITVEGSQVGSITQILMGSSDEQRAYRNRRAMLDSVKRIWVNGVLETSLQNLVSIELGLEERTDAVEHPWSKVLRISDRLDQILPEGTRITDVFDKTNQLLLILGMPGSGKTTTLLELARDMILRAEEDPVHPIPVVLLLSSWENKETSFARWIVTELNSKYKVSTKLGQTWVDNGDLLLLLDGLDEVREELQESCIDAINSFRREYGLMPVAVTSRSEDYERLTIRLELNGAVFLQHLSLDQVDKYLIELGTDFVSTRELLREDVSLQEVVKSPLMVNIMILAYKGYRNVKSFGSIDTQRNHLFDTYTQRQLSSRGGNELYSFEETTSWLIWLAKNLQSQSQTIFMLEDIQPDWLETSQQRIHYIFYVILICSLLIGVGFAGIGERLWNTSYKLLLGITCSVISGFIFSHRILNKYPTNGPKATDSDLTQKSRWRTFALVVRDGITAFVIAFLFYGFIEWYYGGWRVGLLNGAFDGLMFGLSFGLIFGESNPANNQRNALFRICLVETLNWSWKPMLKQFIQTLWDWIIIGFPFVCPLCGVLLVVQYHFIVNPTATIYRLVSDIFLLPITLWFTIGLYLPLIFGLRNGLAISKINTKIFPNQGIWQSARNSTRAFLFFFLVFGVIGGIFDALTYIVNLTASSSLLNNCSTDELVSCLLVYLGTQTIVSTIYVGLVAGIVGGLWYGGLTVIQHSVLRLILYRDNLAPLPYTQFLDYGVQKQLLRKVGGGYMFIHRLLLEYFANLTPSAVKIHEPHSKKEMISESCRSFSRLVKKLNWRWHTIFAMLAIIIVITTFSIKKPYQEILAASYDQQALYYTLNGDGRRAMQRFEQAIRLDPENTAYYRNGQCWFGTILDKAVDVMEACNEAVLLDPNPSYYDSRGLARAALGDFEGAIQDFKHSSVVCRISWIQQLEDGENPVNETLLDGLRANPLWDGC